MCDLQNTKPVELAWLFCVLLLLMVLGRAAFVFPLSFVHNWWAKDRLSVREMVVIWWIPLLPLELKSLFILAHLLYSSCIYKSEDRTWTMGTAWQGNKTCSNHPVSAHLLGPGSLEWLSVISQVVWLNTGGCLSSAGVLPLWSSREERRLTSIYPDCHHPHRSHGVHLRVWSSHQTSLGLLTWPWG